MTGTLVQTNDQTMNERAFQFTRGHIMVEKKQSNIDWAHAILNGKVVRMDSASAEKLVSFINEFCGFRVKTSEKEGKVTIEKV